MFEQINERINKIDMERQELSEQVAYDHSQTSDRLKLTEDRLEITQSQFANMKEHTRQVQEELVQLKEKYRETSDDIIAQLEKMTAHMIKDFSRH